MSENEPQIQRYIIIPAIDQISPKDIRFHNEYFKQLREFEPKSRKKRKPRQYHWGEVEKLQKADEDINPKDAEYWSGNPPEEVILASGSIRKAILFIAQIKDFKFEVKVKGKFKTITTPMELNNYLNENIKNGNGSLKNKEFLGYFYGVPLYAEPSEGETSSNEKPGVEASLKATWLLEKKYKNRNVLIVSTDTVDKPDSASSPLGKPENEVDGDGDLLYPQIEDYNLNKEYETACAKYLADFKAKFYEFSDKIIHTNAVAILHALSGKEIGDPELSNIILNVPIDKVKLAGAQVHPDVGGGGILQQIIPWENYDVLFSYFSEHAQEIFLKYSREDLLMALFCQISGAPYVMIELIRIAYQNFIDEQEAAHYNLLVEEGRTYEIPRYLEDREQIIFDNSTL